VLATRGAHGFLPAAFVDVVAADDVAARVYRKAIGFFRRLPYNISQITLSRNGPGWHHIQKTSTNAALEVIYEESVQDAQTTGKDGFRRLTSWVAQRAFWASSDFEAYIMQFHITNLDFFCQSRIA
jgi:hypothetical protein